MKKAKAIDLYCGAGGTSAGAEMTGGAQVVFALNHWDVAIKTHSANFPHAKHVNSRVDLTSPGEAPRHDIFFASPECTHHSNARGGRPTSDQQRAGAWDLLPWIEYHRPTFLVFENVKEFRNWGPVGSNGRPLVTGKGKIFEAWIAAIKSMGYRIEMACLNAADFGAATSRDRLFIIGRKGNRSAPFPEPTHSRNPGKALPGMQRMPWRSASEIIDWSLPCPSIFMRVKPLKDKTLLRIEAGLRRFVAPFVVRFRNNMTASGVVEPVGTITAGGAHHGIAVPFLSQYYGNGDGSSVNAPLPTIVTKDRHSLVTAIIGPACFELTKAISPAMAKLLATMVELGITDIGFRMLKNHELSAAQGFPSDYIFHGTSAQITRQIGNSVSPNVGAAITRELLA